MSSHIGRGQKCFSCRSSDGMFEYEETFHCFSCSTTFRKHKTKLYDREMDCHKQEKLELPEDIEYNPNNFSLEALKWSYKYYVFNELIQEYKIGYLPIEKRVFIPNYLDNLLIGYQTRSLSEYDEPKYLSRGSKELFHSRGELTNTVVLVEDALSAIRVGQLVNAVALQGTHGKDIDKIINMYYNVVIWLDGDEAGREGAKELYSKCILYRDTRIIETKLDPKCYTNTEIREYLGEI